MKVCTAALIALACVIGLVAADYSLGYGGYGASYGKGYGGGYGGGVAYVPAYGGGSAGGLGQGGRKFELYFSLLSVHKKTLF